MDTNQASTYEGVAPDHGAAAAAPVGRGRRRRIAVGLVVAAAFSAGAGTAIAANDTDPAPVPPTSSMVDEMEQMHESPAAREMHQQLPPELRASMDEMHGRMLEMMRSGPTS
jgi:hypothetical protein